MLLLIIETDFGQNIRTDWPGRNSFSKTFLKQKEKTDLRLLFLLLLFLAAIKFAGPRPGVRPQCRSARSPAAAPVVPPPPNPLPRASEPHSWVASIIVYIANFFITSLAADRSRFFSGFIVGKIGNKSPNEISTKLSSCG